MDQTRIATLVADLQKRLDEKCRARYGRSMLVLDATHDQLDEASPLETLLTGLHLPAVRIGRSRATPRSHPAQARNHRGPRARDSGERP